MYFRDRDDAGEKLAHRLAYLQDTGAVVLALPRGGVVLGAIIARSLRAPLGLILVRKISHPANEEYAIGAIAENDPPLYNNGDMTAIDHDWLTHAETAARELIQSRRALYYGNDFTPPTILHKTVVVVDDGMATGLTMEAAIASVLRHKPKRTIVAVPVASHDSITLISRLVDEVIVLDNPDLFLGAVVAHYQLFEQVNDDEVTRLLREVHYDLQQTTTTGAGAFTPRSNDHFSQKSK
jgi:predicted phosphoribosyltransferase